jgi:hypothetical protein
LRNTQLFLSTITDKKIMEELKALLNDWKIWLTLSLTLGLAPFVPEPHLIGKLRWVAGGAVGMQFIDWLDLLLHGFPWLFLARALTIKLLTKVKA